jgi:predicted transcriptional regulator
MFPKKFIETTLYSSFLLIILFNVTIPTILDRSVSVTVIGSLKKSDVPLSLEEIRNNFQEIYVLQQDAVNIRLKEQIANGNIQRNDEGNFYLTKKGELTSQIMLGMSNAFNVNTAYIDQ